MVWSISFQDYKDLSLGGPGALWLGLAKKWPQLAQVRNYQWHKWSKEIHDVSSVMVLRTIRTMRVDKNIMVIVFGVLKLVHMFSFEDWLAWLLFLSAFISFFLETSSMSSCRWVVLKFNHLRKWKAAYNSTFIRDFNIVLSFYLPTQTRILWFSHF